MKQHRISNGARISLGNTDNFLIQHFEAKDIQISANNVKLNFDYLEDYKRNIPITLAIIL